MSATGDDTMAGDATADGRRWLLLLSGPNLNLLGTREPQIYGTATLDDHVAVAVSTANALGFDLRHEQHNHEGEILDAVHAARGTVAGIVINPGAFTHYSWALHDALAAFDGPVGELHLANPAARESFRAVSVVAPVASGTIAGFGSDGYRLAVEAIAGLLGGGA